MNKILRNCKLHKGKFVLLVILILFQVACELMLPWCTRDLIDIGVGQKGIRDVLQESISVDGMNKMLLLMTEEEQSAVLSVYQKEESVYRRSDLTATQRETLLPVMTAPMVAVYALTTEGADYEEVLGEDLYIPRDVDAFMLLGMLSYETRMELTEATKEQLRSVSQNLINQAAVNFIKDDLELQGVDVDKMQRDFILRYLLIMTASVILGMIAVLKSWQLISWVSADYAEQIRIRLFRQLMQSEGKHHMSGTTALTARVQGDTALVQNGIQSYRQLFYSFCFILSGGILACNLSTGSGWIAGVFGVGIWIILILLQIFAVPLQTKIRKVAEKSYAQLRRMAGGLMLIRVSGTDDKEVSETKEILHSYLKYNRRGEIRNALCIPVFVLCTNLCFYFLADRSVTEINLGGMTIGSLAAMIELLLFMLAAGIASVKSINILAQAYTAGKRIKEVWPEQENELKEHFEITDEKSGHAVELRDVCFSSDPSHPVLDHLSLTLDYGKVTIIQGETGSGKTVLFKLLSGMLKADEGKIILDGKELDNYGKEELHDLVGYIPQKVVLLSGTVADNLRWRRSKATKEEMEKALRIAQAEEFLAKTGKGSESEVAYGANNYSGGQKQRICIARGLVGDPGIIICDNCFSALDRGTFDKVWKGILRQYPKSAILVLTGEERIREGADRIFRLQNGKLVQESEVNTYGS